MSGNEGKSDVDPRVFKLIVRAFGVYLLVQSVMSLLTTGCSGLAMFGAPTPLTFGQTWSAMLYYVPASLATVFNIGLGVYLMRGAPELVRWCVRKVSARCLMCDYDVRDVRGRCPECGCQVASGSVEEKGYEGRSVSSAQVERPEETR